MKQAARAIFLSVFLLTFGAASAAPLKNGGDPTAQDPFAPLQSLKKEGRWEAALAWLDERQETLPAQHWWLERARVLAAMGRIREAAEAFETALQQREPEAEIWSELKQLRMQQARMAYQHVLNPEKAAKAKQEKSDTEAVRQALERWRQAWSKQDVKTYLSAYAPGFRPLSGLSHRAWAAQRRQRLTRPRFIEVKIEQVKVRRLSPVLMETTFVQHYRNDRFKDTVRKKLVWRKGPDGWRIVREEVLK